jgi:hypothetical protein
MGLFSFLLRVVAIPALLALLYVSELRHWLPAFRLFTFIIVFLALADVASLLRGKARDLLIVAASIALGLSIFEAAAMALEPKRIVHVATGLWGPKPELGWGPQAPGRFHAERIDPKTGGLIYSADYTIDENLLRQTKSCQSGPAVVFFGCSFTFGDGINDADAMPQIFADLFDRKQRVLNLGFEAYGPQQFLRSLETGQFDAVIGRRPTLFVFLTAASLHTVRTSCKASFVLDAPRYALENGRPVYKGPCAAGANRSLRLWLGESAFYRVVVQPLSERPNHDDIETYVDILLAAVDLAREKYGVATLIPYLRSDAAYLKGTGFDDDAIMKRLQDGGAYVVDASLVKDGAEGEALSIKGDGHPTPLANRLRASLLKDYMESTGLLASRNDARRASP